MRCSDRPPSARVDRFRVNRIQAQVECACLCVGKQHAQKGLAAIRRPINPALLVCARHVPHHCDIDAQRIFGMNAYDADMATVRQATKLPCRSCVTRLPDAIAAADVAAPRAFAASGPDDIGIGRGDRDGANRAAKEAVADTFPSGTTILGLPHAATCATKVVDVAIADHAGNRSDPAATKRTDQPPITSIQQLGRHRPCWISHLFTGRVLSKQRSSESSSDEQRR